MSARTFTQNAEPPIWTGWHNAVINGTYPLRKLVFGSEHSAVFLTERAGAAVTDAALKIIPIERVTLAQLSHWKAASQLSHPHLLQLFDAGLCQLEGRQFLFVVMEYAHETLSGVLARRALSEEETRELLPPTLAALSFLHGQDLVLSRLKPSNVLVVDDQLKLASDGIRLVGAPRVDLEEPSFYWAPEADRSAFSTADDIWGLGVTLVEALTRELPSIEAGDDAVRLPEALPTSFSPTVQRCLSLDPTARPSAAQLEAQLTGEPEIPAQTQPSQVLPAPSVAQGSDATSIPTLVNMPSLAPSAIEAAASAAAENDPERTDAVERPEAEPRAIESSAVQGRTARTATIATMAVGLIAIAGIALHRSGTHPAAVPPPQPIVIPAAAPSVAPPVTPPSAAPEPRATVVHQASPQVSRSALKTIRGHIKIAVVVVVDRSGAVVAAHLKNSGPSSYFANRAQEAARKWRFSAGDKPGREWLLRFEFSREGVTSSAAANP